MWGFGPEFWENGSLAPEWNDNATTPEGVQENNPLAMHCLIIIWLQ